MTIVPVRNLHRTHEDQALVIIALILIVLRDIIIEFPRRNGLSKKPTMLIPSIAKARMMALRSCVSTNTSLDKRLAADLSAQSILRLINMTESML